MLVFLMESRMKKENLNNPIHIFVYGTLKRGFWNHKRFCRNAVNIRPAIIWGRLYHLPAGFPGLKVPQSSILAKGSKDLTTDAKTQNSIILPRRALNSPAGDWDHIFGEIMTFNNPLIDIPPIDQLEGFNPYGMSMYQRIMVPAFSKDSNYSVWTYRYMGMNGERTNGNWKGVFN